MAWIQNVTPPKNEKHEFNLGVFTGGLNNRANMIEDHQASDLLNMAFTHLDVMEKRKGMKLFDDFKLNDPITYMNIYKPYDKEDQLIRATDKEVYANQTKIADVQGTIDGVNFQGLFFFCDGEDLYAYGYFPQTTGTYSKIIGLHSSDVPATLRVVNPPEGFTPLGEEHTRGVMVYNYNEKTVHYEPCVHELDDVYLQANVLPEHPRFIEVHKGRLFVSGDRKDDDNVFMTHVNNPFYFAVALPIQLPPNSDRVRGLIVYDDCVIVGREHDIYRITGETNNPTLGFELHVLRKINTHTGIANNKCWSRAHHFLFFLGSDGVAYAISTTRMDERLLATQIISPNIDVFRSPINATTETILDASSVFDSDFWYINMGDKTLVYSYRHRAWTLYDYVDMHAPLYYYDRVIWGRHDGTVAEFGDEYHDNGRPIFAFWKSKAFDMGHAIRYKQFREFYIVSETFQHYDSDIRVTFEIDYADVRGLALIRNQISTWGKTKFGERFKTRNINSSIPFMIGRRARNFRVIFANGYQVMGEVETHIDLYDVPKKFNYMAIYVKNEDSYYYYENGEWILITERMMNQPMVVYQVTGEYEMKGKR